MRSWMGVQIMTPKRITTDVLVIGAGGAGLRAAISAHDLGNTVTIVSKSLLGKAHTVMAEGGIAAAVRNVDSKDSWKVHFADTFDEGVYLGNWRMVEILAKDAPECVYELERYGALFDRTADGKIMQRAFGAHTYRRLCHVADKTGLEIIRTLEDQVLHRKVEVMDEVLITKLLKDKNGVLVGAIGLSMREGEFVVFNCKAVIMATGGAGLVYRVTSNSWESTGDGMALAYNAGVELQDMEMIQFHPTGMVYPQAAKGLLVTEGVRGEGGILLNSKKERFMLKYSPEKKELDARDVVARAVNKEIVEGRGTEHGGVYLDISYKGSAFVLKKLPGMYMQFKDLAGVDITKHMMEVAPTVHYFMGGIRVAPETGETNVKGIFAAGEVASGLHGANRLGGNSLADILIFGKRTGNSAGKYATLSKIKKIPEEEVEKEISRINAFLNKKGTNPNLLVDALRDTMSADVGIIRNGRALNAALKRINEMKKKASAVSANGTLKFNHGLMWCIELDHMLTVCECIVRSAIERKESRGAHTRSDYKKKEREWLKNIICTNEKGKLKISYLPVEKLPKRLEVLVKPEVYS